MLIGLRHSLFAFLLLVSACARLDGIVSCLENDTSARCSIHRAEELIEKKTNPPDPILDYFVTSAFFGIINYFVGAGYVK